MQYDANRLETKSRDARLSSDAQKAAAVRLAAKTMRDSAWANPQEREVMRDVIALPDSSLSILFDALESI